MPIPTFSIASFGVIFGPANDDRSSTKPTATATKKGISQFFILRKPTPTNDPSLGETSMLGGFFGAEASVGADLEFDEFIF